MGKANRWSLDASEVTWSASGSSGGRNKVRQNRNLGASSYTFTVMHKLTGLEVSGSVPLGHYSRSEMRQLKRQLFVKLFRELEDKVAKHLRIPGR